MRIVIKSWGDFLGIIRSIGLLAMNGYGPDYFVIDKELFFLSVLKHGIEFEKEKVLKDLILTGKKDVVFVYE